MSNAILQGTRIEPFVLTTIQGRDVPIPADDGIHIHLQFRRFAGCPICNLHLRSVAKRVGEIERAGIREVVVFHSDRESMLPYQGDLPMAVIADPEKLLYARFGVRESLLGVLDPRTAYAAVRGMFSGHPKHLTRGDEGGHLGMPADFLIDPTGLAVAVKYGKYADDQWSVDEVLALVNSAA